METKRRICVFQNCNNKFLVTRVDKIYCSVSCKKKAGYWKKLKEKFCIQCGISLGMGIRKKFCSNKCKIQYPSNRERILKEKKKDYIRHKKHYRAQQQKYYKDNKEKILLQDKKYYSQNKERILKVNKIYQKNNKDQIYQQQRKREKEKMKDPLYRKIISFRSMKYINSNPCLKLKMRLRKNFKSAMKKYLIKLQSNDSTTKFKVGKSKEYDINYGLIIKKIEKDLGRQLNFSDLNKEVEHTIPLALFNLENSEEVKKAWLPENITLMDPDKHKLKSSHEQKNGIKKINKKQEYPYIDYYKKFKSLQPTSKLPLCGLPLRIDSYSQCYFSCKYCFSQLRTFKGKETNTQFKIADLKWLENKLEKIYIKKEINPKNLLDVLLKERITWHFGGMSEPFQPIEKVMQITHKILKITNKYNISILFSTKSHDVYNWENLKPEIHSFQLSFSNDENRKDLEPNVESFEKRYQFFKELKKRGFKVGIRIQPFIPGITKISLIEKFKDADYITIESLKLTPQNKEHVNFFKKLLNINSKDLISYGLLHFKPELRLKCYRPFIKKMKEYSIPFSIADNDFHHLTSSKCCCGENLIKKSTNFNNTALCFKYGDYSLENVKKELKPYQDCGISNLYSPDNRLGCSTLKDFFEKKFDMKKSVFSKNFLIKK